MGGHGFWGRLATAGALLLAAAQPAAGRPLTPEDLLRVEGVGRIEVAPGGRWLLLERRAAVRDGWRFDHDRYNVLFRTTLQLVDLRRPGPPQDLTPREPGVGYLLGPAAPDGTRAAVFRLKEGRFELGIATLAARHVRWTGLTPDLAEYGRAVQWRSADELVLLQIPEGRLPFLVRWVTPALQLPERWRAWASGEGAHTVVGSGRYLGLRPRDPPLRLMVLDVGAGSTRTLAEGEFRDLELSSGGRFAALAVAGPDIGFRDEQAIHLESNLAKTRLRLQLVDLETGHARTVRPDWDLSSQLLAWSPRGARLLVHARPDGAPWRDGRLLEVDALTGAVRDRSDRIAPEVFSRPETVAAGWFDEDPVVYGRGPGSTRPDWWRLSPEAPINLTAALPAFGLRGGTVGDQALVLPTPEGTAAIGAGGETLRTTRQALRPAAPQVVGPLGRVDAFLAVSGVVSGTTSDALLQLGQASVRRWPIPAGAELLAAGEAGALVRTTAGGGADTLFWTAPGKPPARLFSLNAHLAEVERPAVHPVRHAGPDGEPRTSWLLAPGRPADAPPPPLVVVPYLGQAHARPPASLDPRNSPSVDLPGLLAGHGYAVLLPSLPIPNEAIPSDGVAQRLLAIVDAAAADPALKGAFDPARLALAGDSFGGYSVLAAIGQTDRFKAAVVWAAMPNLFGKWGDFGYPTRVSPERGLQNTQWVEGVQAQMHGPPWKTTDRYLAGSPLLHLGEARTPLLIGHGELDNFGLGAAEQAFSAYLRRNADAQLVTYWGEGHRLSSPGNYRDFHRRVFAWLDQHTGGPAPTSRAPGG